MNADTNRIRRAVVESLRRRSEQPREIAAGEKVRTVEQRWARTEERAKYARARLRAKAAVLGSSTAEAETAGALRRAQDVERAQAIADGREIAAPLPPALDLEAVAEEQRLLAPLLNQARSEREAVQAELDAEASALMAPAQRAANRDLDRALEDLHRAYTAVCDPFVKLQALGYRPNLNVLPFFNLPHVAVLGDPNRPETIAGRFRSWLRRQGVA